MGLYNCEMMICKLEGESIKHQIFYDVNIEDSPERAADLKKLAALADHFGIEEFINAFKTYIEMCKDRGFHNLIEAMLFEPVFEKYRKKFSEILDFSKQLESEGIREFPISSKYDIEEWANFWNVSVENLNVLENWFYIDYNKIEK